MDDYQSIYTGEEIDAGIGKANTAVQPVDLQDYQLKIDNLHKLSADLISDGETNKTVTSNEKSIWNAKSDFSGNYNDLTNKPTIPETLSDLSDDSTHRLVTDTEKTTWDSKGTYSKPIAGIPEEDLSEEVQDKLNSSGYPDDYLESIEIVRGGSYPSDVADGKLMNWYKGTLNDNGSVITNIQQDGTRYVNLKPIKLHEGDTISIKSEYANTLAFIPYAYSTNNLSNSSQGQGGSTSWIDCVIGNRDKTWGNSFTYDSSTATGYENEGTNITDPAYFRFVVRTADLQNHVVVPTLDDWNNIVNDVFDFSEVTYDEDNSAFYPIITSPDTVTITDNHGNETSFNVSDDASGGSSESSGRGFIHKELLSSGYICHRGYFDNNTYIENSISALDRGYEAGAKLFEVDLRMTSDGVPVLMHDTTVNRTTDGTGTVTNMTLAQIQQLHMKNSSTEGVPTLEDVLIWTKLHDVVLELDMANRQLSTTHLSTIYNMVRDKGMLGQVFFTVLLEDANKLQQLDNTIIMCIERIWSTTDAANLVNFKTNRLIFAGSEYTYSTLGISRVVHSLPNAKYRTWLSTTRQSAETEILTKGVDYVITEGFYTLMNNN